MAAALNTVSEEKPIDEFHWHEVCDRTWLVMETLACALEDHPVIKANPDLEALLGKAHSALFELYQTAAAKHLGL